MNPRSALLVTTMLALASCTAPASQPSATPHAVPPSDPPAATTPTPAPSVDVPVDGGALVVWARGDLPASFATEVAGLPGVRAVAHVRGATLGLTGSRDADGAVMEHHTDGYRVPVDVVALDPATYAATLSDEQAATSFDALRPGTVLLTETGAMLRGVGTGARLDIGGVSGLTVVGVVPDDVAGRAEIVAHEQDADALGLDDDGTVFIRHDAVDGAPTEALVTAIEARIPADLTARVVDVGVPDQRRRAPLVLSLLQVKNRFGEFSFRPRPRQRAVDLAPGFVARNIVTSAVPLLGNVTCHRAILDDLTAALTAIRDAGLGDLIDPDRYGGCFNARRISSDGDRLSHHAWGIALDINVDLSQPGGGAPPHPEIVAAFERHGFRWGGDFIHADNHHFEWIGP